MNLMTFATATTFLLAASASADFIGVTVDITEDINSSGLTQYRFSAQFDHDNDRMNNWGGYVNLGVPFRMATNAPAGFNQTGNALDPVWGWDCANAYAYMLPQGITDTWLAAGDTGFLSPNFITDIGGHVGAYSEIEIIDGGVLAPGPGILVGQGEIVLANLVVEDGYGVELSGVVGWYNTSGQGHTNAFAFNNIPAPGALALIGLAGFATTRRRR